MDNHARNTPVSDGVSSAAREISEERTNHDQETCNDLSGSLSWFPFNDSASTVVETRSDDPANTLKLMVSSFRAVLIGQSGTKQVSNDRCCDREKLSIEEQAHSRTTDSFGIILSSLERPMPLIKKQGYLNGPQCERIMEKLEILQDNGKFREHEYLAISLLQLCATGNKPDMELALKIERGVAFSYQKESKKSKSMFTSLIQSDKNKTCHALNSNILMARAYFLYVADRRKRKPVKLQWLFECLKRSEFLLQNHHSPEDWAELYQNYGRLWLDRMSLIPDDQRNAPARTAARENARYYFEQAISYSQEDHRPRAQVKRQRHIRLGLATLLLDCVSTAARTRVKAIPSSDIKEAEEHLNIIQQNLGVSVPTGTRIQLLKKRSDQFYRQGFLQLARRELRRLLF